MRPCPPPLGPMATPLCTAPQVLYSPFKFKYDAVKRLMCGNMTLMLETWWFNSWAALMDVDPSVLAGAVVTNQMGTYGETGIFIPKLLLDKSFCLFHYRAYEVCLGCRGPVLTGPSLSVIRWFFSVWDG